LDIVLIPFMLFVSFMVRFSEIATMKSMKLMKTQTTYRLTAIATGISSTINQ
jgi:hypothetical protein